MGQPARAPTPSPTSTACGGAGRRHVPIWRVVRPACAAIAWLRLRVPAQPPTRATTASAAHAANRSSRRPSRGRVPRHRAHRRAAPAIGVRRRAGERAARPRSTATARVACCIRWSSRCGSRRRPPGGCACGGQQAVATPFPRSLARSRSRCAVRTAGRAVLAPLETKWNWDAAGAQARVAEARRPHSADESRRESARAAAHPDVGDAHARAAPAGAQQLPAGQDACPPTRRASAVGAVSADDAGTARGAAHQRLDQQHRRRATPGCAPAWPRKPRSPLSNTVPPLPPTARGRCTPRRAARQRPADGRACPSLPPPARGAAS